ncbi:MAG: right-handed parallel beta-helix repeat-containing protein [Phycisphaerales bacterium]
MNTLLPAMMMGIVSTASASDKGAGLDIIIVDRDNIEIHESCVVRIPADLVIEDSDNNGVIHVLGDDIHLQFEEGSVLRGAALQTQPDAMHGIGIVASGENMTLSMLEIAGYKVGVQARECNNLVIEDVSIADMFRQRLGSTDAAEDASDWLRPHVNDNGEWVQNYGAAISLVACAEPHIRRVKVRRAQNGIVFDRVNAGIVSDSDCSFLSGWGLAMWRSGMNIISRNAFDFCVRGYSHGKYNRGQDSAGLLMFEQCSDNVIAENSITHGGDGIFGFAGSEALQNAETRRLGNNRNLFIRNDLSYAVAHGLEMTFSFDNQVIENRFEENAICGIWGGYSQDMTIARNTFTRNGDMPYGRERGGVNIEHGLGNVIVENSFAQNACGVHLWWDEDAHFKATPWATLHQPEDSERMLPSMDNIIAMNRFDADTVGIELRACDETFVADNTFTDVDTPLRNEASEVVEESLGMAALTVPAYPAPGETQPIGKRSHLAGREHIRMTEWGPYDWESPLLFREARSTSRAHSYILLGAERVLDVQWDNPKVIVETRARQSGIVVVAHVLDGHGAFPYNLTVETDAGMTSGSGCLVVTQWEGVVFNFTNDPRTDEPAWLEESRNDSSVPFVSDTIDFRYAVGGPATVLALQAEGIGNDRFGMIARTTIELPRGTWRIVSESDDGIRISVDGEVLIDDWTHHGPTRHEAAITVEHDTQLVELEVMHFELDGFAVCVVELEPQAQGR